MAITFQEPKTGRTQQVGENEHVRIATLKRLGWKQVKDAQATVQEATPVAYGGAIVTGDAVLSVTEIPVAYGGAIVTVEQEFEADAVGDAVLSITEIPIEDGEDVTVELPAPDDTQAAKEEKLKAKGR